MRYSPWADAASRYPDILIERTDIAPMRGAWIPTEKMILIDQSLNPGDRRSTLAHELAHIDLGHTPVQGWFGQRMERDAHHLADTRLLGDIDAIAEAIAAHPLDPAAVAEHLGVGVGSLRRRLRRLTDEQKQRITDRLARCEHTA